jgi:hypothetical protein
VAVERSRDARVPHTRGDIFAFTPEAIIKLANAWLRSCSPNRSVPVTVELRRLEGVPGCRAFEILLCRLGLTSPEGACPLDHKHEVAQLATEAAELAVGEVARPCGHSQARAIPRPPRDAQEDTPSS